jgi:NADH-quinone oxidoreductase subunit H
MPGEKAPWNGVDRRGLEGTMGFWRDPVKFIIDWFVGVLVSTGMSDQWVVAVSYLVGSIVLVLGGILFVLFLIWYERKLIGRMQDRFGPNRVGPWGIIQPIADMLKIFTKELITPAGADKVPFNIAPILSVGAVLMMWAVTPFSKTVFGVNLNVGILWVIAVGGLSELAVILAGWGSNNKFSLVGSLRAVAMLISYEVPLVLSALIPVMMSGTMSLVGIVEAQTPWFIVTAPAAAILFFIASVAESGRAPFDLAEAESELVAGYNVEYSGLKFGMFFVGEFLHAFTTSFIFVTVFLGGWRGPGAEQIPVLGLIWFAIKTFIVYFALIFFRGTNPRFRIDQLMNFTWKVMTPLALAVFMVVAVVGRIAFPTEWLRVVALFGANILVLLIAERIISHSLVETERPVVTTIKRPVARPDNVFIQPGSGAEG